MVACRCGDTFASKAKTRVTIQNQATLNDRYGGRSTGWVNEYDRWAIVTAVNAREPFQSGQHQSRVTHKVTIRYISGLNDTTTAAKRQVKIGSRILQVVGIHNLDETMKAEGNRYQTMLCVEGEPS